MCRILISFGSAVFNSVVFSAVRFSSMSKPRGVIKVAKSNGPDDVAQLVNADYEKLGQVQQTRVICGLKKFIHAEGRGCGWYPYLLEDSIFSKY